MLCESNQKHFSLFTKHRFLNDINGGILIDGMSPQPLNSESLKSLIEEVEKKMEEKLGEIGVKSASFQLFCLFS
jgi:hypothetical protein